MSLAISIINYNSKDLLIKLLSQLETQIAPSTQVWVVDNASPDDFREIVRKQFPKFRFIQSKENGGFAKGHNLVLKQLKTEYALIINPDTEISGDSVNEMVKFMDDNPKCAIASCKIVGYDGIINSNGGNFPFGFSLINWLFNLEMIPLIGKYLPNFHRMGSNYYNKKASVDWVGGTFMMARLEALKKVGYFNEDYFMYFEDADLCYKLKKMGFEIMINPSITIKHKGGASSQDPRFAQFRGELSGLKIFYQSHGNFLDKILINPLIYLAIILRIFSYFVLRQKRMSETYKKVLNHV